MMSPVNVLERTLGRRLPLSDRRVVIRCLRTRDGKFPLLHAGELRSGISPGSELIARGDDGHWPSTQHIVTAPEPLQKIDPPDRVARIEATQRVLDKQHFRS